MGNTRKDGRASDALREVSVELAAQRNPEGSVLYRCGGTTVLVSASVDEGVPDFMRGKEKGWVTAEYAMHPRANPRRQSRDGRRGGGIDGRSQEIQRLIGRALRGAVRAEKLGERTITIDCDVLDADGGTRTASITAAFIALALSLDKLRSRGLVLPGVLRDRVAAVSVGVVDGTGMLDLCYEEDKDADVDLNVVSTSGGGIVEVQGTSEGSPITRAQFDGLLDLALAGIARLHALQDHVLADAGVALDKLAL